MDLSSRYLGMELANPLVASASPLTGDFDRMRRLEEVGLAAVVLPSLFEEQIALSDVTVHRVLEGAAEGNAEAFEYYLELDEYNAGPRFYLEYLETAKQALSIPVIASLNGGSLGDWVRYAKWLEDAGADALELNVYYVAADPDITAADVEGRYLELVSGVRQAISIPLAVKVGPYFSAMANMAHRLVEAGADGLVLFNRFLQPDIDLDTMSVVPRLQLSTPDEVRLPLRWIALLRGRIEASLAATSGVHTPEDAVKLLLAGADAVMMASALIRHGPDFASMLLDGVAVWLEANGYESVSQAKGSMSQKASPDPAAFERANYMQAIVGFSSRLHS
jgi:dihydroorotate dehydrogenase (fumarate)